MRIVLIGQAAFGQKVLERLIECRENVVAVYCPPDSPRGPVDPLKETARNAGIPVFQPARMNNPAVITEYLTLRPDLNIMAFVTDIVPGRILRHPTQGSIQYHPSLLPKHRGRSAINWAVVKGERKTGVSIFWVDEGIDTGPLLLQKEVTIDPDDTTGSLYFNKLFPLGVDALMESLDLIRARKAPRIEQDDSQATYEPPYTEQYARIDWKRPGREVYNLIRGCDPQPGAYTVVHGKKLQIYATVPLFGPEFQNKGLPGHIVRIREDGIVVSVQGGALLLQRMRLEGQGKMGAADFAQREELKESDTL